MSNYTVVALDAMGGDNAPSEIVKGAVDAVNESKDVKVRLYGDEGKIRTVLGGYTYNHDQVEVIHTSQEIDVEEAPVSAIRTKKDSSLVRAIQSVKAGESDAVVSAGSSGAEALGHLRNRAGA